MLPSWTALSTFLTEAVPTLARYLGPINPLKFGAPLLMAWVWLRKDRIPAWVRKLLLASVAALVICSALAAAPCGFPPGAVREASVFVLGLVASLAFLTLERRDSERVAFAWVAIVYGSFLLSAFFPSVTSWINAHVFDPVRANSFDPDLGYRVIVGFFDPASMAKLILWVPWILLATQARSPKGWKVALALVLVTIPMTIATTQRGPFVAAWVAFAAFALHQAVRSGRPRALIPLTSFLVAGTLAIFLVVPSSIWKPRLLSWFSSKPQTTAEKISVKTIRDRPLLFGVSWKLVKENPLGTACPPEKVFLDAGLKEVQHSHNMLLEQFRIRGWLWGAWHLVLWLLALAGSWRGRERADAARFGAVVACLVLGLVDHPWFVLNHAMLLGIILVSPIMSLGKKPEEAL